MWRDLSFLVLTPRRRRTLLYCLAFVVAVFIALAAAFNDWQLKSEVTAHTKHTQWCGTSPVVAVAVCVVGILVLAIAGISFLGLRHDQEFIASVSLSAYAFLSTSAFFAGCFFVFFISFVTLFLTLSGSSQRIPILVFGVLILNLTHFLSIFATRLYYLHRHKDIVGQSSSDTALAKAMESTQINLQSFSPDLGRDNLDGYVRRRARTPSPDLSTNAQYVLTLNSTNTASDLLHLPST